MHASGTSSGLAAFVHVSSHPLAAARLAVLRNSVTQPQEFRRTIEELTIVLLLEAARTWKVTQVTVTTPLASCDSEILARPIVAVPILRAGLGMLSGVQRLLPEATVGHVGLYRDEETLRPVTYFSRLPVNIGAAQAILLDPMLATGHSACEAVAILKAQGATAIQFLCVVAAPQGVDELTTQHPDVAIFTAAIDPQLNAHGYIVPGLGDAGDRCFGTG